MHNDQILINTVAIQNNIIARSYSNNDILTHEKLCSLSRYHGLEQSFPAFKNNASFSQFIAEEKYNLQFFPSFIETEKLAVNEKNQKILMTNFLSLPCNVPNNCYSAFNNSNIFDDDETTSCVPDSSNFSISMCNESKREEAKSLTRIHAPATTDTLSFHRRRRMRCVERYISYMTNDQTKAARGFILQLNTYINQNSLELQKKSNEFDQQFHGIPEKSIELRTTSNLDFTPTSHLNDVDLVEANDNIDISLQLSDHFDALSPLILKKNDHLLGFYNRAITNMINIKTDPQRSNDWFLDDETGIYSVVHLSLQKEGQSQNQQASVSTLNSPLKKDSRTRTKTSGFGCCCRPNNENRAGHHPIFDARIKTELKKNEELSTNAEHKLREKTTIGLPMAKTVQVSDVSTLLMQENETSAKSLEHSEMENSKSNKTQINIFQQSTMVNSSLTDSNYDFRKSSTDFQYFVNGSIEQKPSIPLHSRCLVLLELANRDEHLIEVVEVPRLFHRVSRIDVFQKLRGRLTIVDIIDIDLTALLRSVLQSFYD